MRTSPWLLDEGEGIAEVWQVVFGGEGVVSGADLDGAVAAGGAYQLPDGQPERGLADIAFWEPVARKAGFDA